MLFLIFISLIFNNLKKVDNYSDTSADDLDQFNKKYVNFFKIILNLSLFEKNVSTINFSFKCSRRWNSLKTEATNYSRLQKYFYNYFF